MLCFCLDVSLWQLQPLMLLMLLTLPVSKFRICKPTYLLDIYVTASHHRLSQFIGFFLCSQQMLLTKPRQRRLHLSFADNSIQFIYIVPSHNNLSSSSWIPLCYWSRAVKYTVMAKSSQKNCFLYKLKEHMKKANMPRPWPYSNQVKALKIRSVQKREESSISSYKYVIFMQWFFCLQGYLSRSLNKV